MLQPTKKKDKNAQQSIFQSISHQLRIQLKKQSNQNVTFKQFYPAYDQTHVVWIQKQTYTADHQILRENILYHISSSSKILSSFSSSQKNQAFQRLEMVSDDQVIIFLKPFCLLEKEDKHIVIHQWSLKQDQIITERFPFQSRFPFAYVFPESNLKSESRVFTKKQMDLIKAMEVTQRFRIQDKAHRRRTKYQATTQRSTNAPRYSLIKIFDCLSQALVKFLNELFEKSINCPLRLNISSQDELIFS